MRVLRDKPVPADALSPSMTAPVCLVLAMLIQTLSSARFALFSRTEGTTRFMGFER